MGNIKHVKQINDYQTYDIEVNHQDHQFYLSNGVLTSNSHSILYSMTSYKTAYLKGNYPVEFLLANLMAEIKSNAPDAKTNIEKIKKEMRSHKVHIQAPDLNRSQLTYQLIGENILLTGLDALKFVSDDAINDIIAKRPFKDFQDFMSRVDSRKVRANTIQALAAAGCLDQFGLTRKQIFLYVSDYRKKLQVWSKKHNSAEEVFIYPWIEEQDWSISEKYALEHFYLGESFICKPRDAYGYFFEDDHKTVKDIRKAANKVHMAPVKGIVRDFFEFKVKKETSKFYGKAMAKATIEDKDGDQISCTIFPDGWEKVKTRIQEINSKAEFGNGIALSFAGSVNVYEDNTGIILNELFNIQTSPAVPVDLKAKKVNLKLTKKDEKIKPESSKEEILETIENHLYDEGLIEISDEIDD